MSLLELIGLRGGDAAGLWATGRSDIVSVDHQYDINGDDDGAKKRDDTFEIHEIDETHVVVLAGIVIVYRASAIEKVWSGIACS